MQTEKKFDRLTNELEMNVLSGTHIELFSNKTLFAEGCYGINEYAPELVRLNLSKGQLLVLGQNLEIRNMNENSITVTGIINSIEFSGVCL